MHRKVFYATDDTMPPSGQADNRIVYIIVNPTDSAQRTCTFIVRYYNIILLIRFPVFHATVRASGAPMLMVPGSSVHPLHLTESSDRIGSDRIPSPLRCWMLLLLLHQSFTSAELLEIVHSSITRKTAVPIITTTRRSITTRPRPEEDDRRSNTFCLSES